MIALYILCLFAVISFGGFVIAIIDLAHDNYEKWND